MRAKTRAGVEVRPGVGAREVDVRELLLLVRALRGSLTSILSARFGGF